MAKDSTLATVLVLSSFVMMVSGIPLVIYWLATWPKKDQWKAVLYGGGAMGAGFLIFPF
jgi:hypothetical protein